MEAIRLHKVVEKDGEISATGLPCKKGQCIKMILLIEPSPIPEATYPTARQLLNSGLIGLWEDARISTIARVMHGNCGNKCKSTRVKIHDLSHLWWQGGRTHH
jgi:hypothetical protein